MIGPAVVVIPAGEFVMGATDDDKFATMHERPRRRVTFARPFALGRHLVTRRQWADYCNVPGAGEPDWPVLGVSFDDALGYVEHLRNATGRSWRLPSEGEWEYACRAGTTGVFHTGEHLTPGQANYLYDERGRVVGVGHPTPVGAYPPNAWGLYDMHGNACELVADAWRPTYGDAPCDGGAVTDDGERRRVIRGGSWDYLPRLLRCAYRDHVDRAARLDHVGFRVALDLPASRARDAAAAGLQRCEESVQS